MKRWATLLPDRFTITRLESLSQIRVPEQSDFFMLSVAQGEITVFCAQSSGSLESAEYNWRAFRLGGEGTFDDTGVTVAYLEPLRDTSVFVSSTYLRDYLLVKECDLPRVYDAYARAGIELLEA
jgi:hypothetical protein